MTGARSGPAIWVLVAALLLAGPLGACGKKGAPRPAEDAASEYTYPRAYPNLPSVIRPGGAPPGQGPAHAGDLSPFPTSRTTTTYGSPPAQ
ncbi:MAG: hypothetical protein ACE5KF_07755 [Kiloniellaceae bacterium]